MAGGGSRGVSLSAWTHDAVLVFARLFTLDDETTRPPHTTRYTQTSPRRPLPPAHRQPFGLRRVLRGGRRQRRRHGRWMRRRHAILTADAKTPPERPACTGTPAALKGLADVLPCPQSFITLPTASTTTLTFFSFRPATHMRPERRIYTPNSSFRRSTCFSLKPVYVNMPRCFT